MYLQWYPEYSPKQTGLKDYKPSLPCMASGWCSDTQVEIFNQIQDLKVTLSLFDGFLPREFQNDECSPSLRLASFTGF